MAKHKLTAKQVSSFPVGSYSDGGGLMLIVKSSGARQWVQRFTYKGKRSMLGLGSVAMGVTLAEARERSTKIRSQLVNGVDPRKEKQRIANQSNASHARTFDDVAKEYIETNEPTWTNTKHIAQWRMTLLGPPKWIEGRSIDYCASIHSKPIAEINTNDILGILKPIWLTKADTASKLRQRIEAIIAYADARDWFSGKNPATFRNHLDKLLPTQAGVHRGHFAAVHFDEMPTAFARIRNYRGIGSLALQFAILTASREHPILNARWQDIDLDDAVWVVPPEHMKGSKGRKRSHRVPLSSAALHILEILRKSSISDYLFEGTNGGPISDATMDQVFKRLGIKATPHGTARSTFRDWISERTEFDGDLAEKALAHVETNKVIAAYRRGDMLDKRRPLMEAWGKYCMSEIQNG